MKIVLSQLDCSQGDVLANTKKIIFQIEKAALLKADVIIFPELSDTAYGKDCVMKFASKWSDENSVFQQLRCAAKSNSIYVLCGLSEKEGNSIYNSLAVFSTKGELVSKYRKKNLFIPTEEHLYTTAGSKTSCVEIQKETFGLSICYDLRFPEMYVEQVNSGAKLLVNIAAWPASRITHWETLLKARAIESQAYVFGANRVGCDDGILFGGRTVAFEPNGDLLAIADEKQEQLLTVDVEISKVDKFRKKIPSVLSRIEG